MPASVLFSDNPVITFTDKDFILSSKSSRLEFPVDNFLNYKVSKTSGLSLPGSASNGVKIDGRTISLVPGCKADIFVYDMKGQVVYSAKTDGSVSTVTLDAVAKGTYIVKVNSFTFKIHFNE